MNFFLYFFGNGQKGAAKDILFSRIMGKEEQMEEDGKDEDEEESLLSRAVALLLSNLH